MHVCFHVSFLVHLNHPDILHECTMGLPISTISLKMVLYMPSITWLSFKGPEFGVEEKCQTVPVIFCPLKNKLQHIFILSTVYLYCVLCQLRGISTHRMHLYIYSSFASAFSDILIVLS